MSEPNPVARTWVSQGLTLHYLDWGNESAPLLLLIHGNSDHARAWDWTARALRNHWHVVAPDLRGHGDSPWSPDGAYLTPYHVQDIADLIDVLGSEQLTIVGHSFGGTLALRYAALYPQRVRKLAIVDGLGPAPQVMARWAQEGPLARTRAWIEKRRELSEHSPRCFSSIDEAVARLMKDNARLSQERARHLASYGVRRCDRGYSWKRDPLVRNFVPEDFIWESTEIWGEITMPALFFYGPESWTTNPVADGRAALFSNARTVVIDQAGHWLHHDQFEAFIAELAAFL